MTGQTWGVIAKVHGGKPVCQFVDHDADDDRQHHGNIKELAFRYEQLLDE
ncbi:MAG: hypothetical protein HC898_09230 [Phycisphaerales bacterium]|nr:hypothetical protein [Phycisphaerales bacterium]